MTHRLRVVKQWSSDPNPIHTDIPTPGKLLHHDNSLEFHPFPDQEQTVPIFDLRNLRQAAEIHRQVRRYIQPYLVPGCSVLDICTRLEAKTVQLCGKNDLSGGIGFPTGFSINNCVAHDSAQPNDSRRLGQNDICKVDFGTHVDGMIIDSAFTVAFNPMFDPLIEATIDATWEGIRLAGPDALVGDISAAIKETIESYEVTIDGKTTPLKPVGNLGGHDIMPYQIHGGTLILNAPHPKTNNMRLKANQLYAIETFATTGLGSVRNDPTLETSHYMKPADHPRVPIKLRLSKQIYSHVTTTRSTLPFCTRWIGRDLTPRYRVGLGDLVRKRIFHSYPPLSDTPGSYSSQMEHTIYIHEYGKEVLSVGDDY